MHRHHHHHAKKHHHHYPKNIGVRFIQSMVEGDGSAADPTVVEDAAPETKASEVEEAAADKAITDGKAKAKAVAAEAEKPPAAAPGPTPEE